MSFEQYRGKEVTIRSTGKMGIIRDLLRKRGSGGGLAVRFLVVDAGGADHQLMPHEVTINKNDHDQKTNPTIQPDAIHAD